MGFAGAMVEGLLYGAVAALAADWVGWNAVIILIGLVGLPALAVGMVANRERRGRAAAGPRHGVLPGTPTPPPRAPALLVGGLRRATGGRPSPQWGPHGPKPLATSQLT